MPGLVGGSGMRTPVKGRGRRTTHQYSGGESMLRRHVFARYSALVALWAAGVLAVVSGGAWTACTSPQRAIVGRWQVVNSAEVWEFHQDGTLVVRGGVVGSSGSYRFIDATHLRVDFGGLLGLAGPQVFEVRISGNRLTLRPPAGGSIELTRLP